ncbi:response regulator transcription factor [Polaribacter sp. IC073]|uniref:response regulator transcription factor n=1 Tax=Polaribacter sp. IC073 TaxID=2508540 RepID=UPI0011BE1009|nr:response regulator [Polaribacter sp. IC073]TXD46867.1 response regulator [Polaribacter sp. IC073]
MYKILIVEDTLTIREEVCDILEMEGYSVFQAINGKIGFEMSIKEHPDLIISDILMPSVDGFEMFNQLQSHKETSAIPLIFLSAKGEKEDIRIGMNLGAEDYLTKPINVNDLVNAVDNKIKKKVMIDQKIIDKTAAISQLLEAHKNQIHQLEDQVLQMTKLLKDL